MVSVVRIPTQVGEPSHHQQHILHEMFEQFRSSPCHMLLQINLIKRMSIWWASKARGKLTAAKTIVYAEKLAWLLGNDSRISRSASLSTPVLHENTSMYRPRFDGCEQFVPSAMTGWHDYGNILRFKSSDVLRTRPAPRMILAVRKYGRNSPIKYLAISVVSSQTRPPNRKLLSWEYVSGTHFFQSGGLERKLLWSEAFCDFARIISVTTIWNREPEMQLHDFESGFPLTNMTGPVNPTDNMQGLMVADFRNGCINVRSSQKNPRLRGSTHKDNTKIGTDTAVIRLL